MIKASALLAAVAIGLLVAGVIATSLLMVYVSIGVCAAAALILAVGVLAHWPEIFGRGDARPASVRETGSAPQAGASLPVLATAASTAAGGWEDPHARHDDGGGPPAGELAEAVLPQQEPPAPGRSDDLWKRVEEELGSAAKRDTGALSWPGTELPVVRESPGSPEQAVSSGEAGPPDASSAGAGTRIRGSGAGWQPPGLSGPAWPPPAAAFAGRPAGPEPATQGTDDNAPPDGTEQASPDSPDHEAAPGAPDDAAAPGPADGEAAPGPAGGQAAETASGPTSSQAGTGQGRPQWIISLPGRDGPPAGEPASAAAEHATEEPVPGPAEEEPVAQVAAATRAAVAGQPAADDAAQDSVVSEPAARESAAGGSAAGEPDAQEPGEAAVADPAEGPGRVEVTVVPGVARYHRSGCILIRFLGADDLEIMTRQEAEEATFVPCRACQPDQLEA